MRFNLKFGGIFSMIVYESTKQEFLEDVFHDELTNNIITNFNEKVGKVNEAEVRSWDNSMQYMHRVLLDEEIPNNSGVAIEFNIPYSSKRVDFIRSEEHTSELQSRFDLVCRLLLEKKKCMYITSMKT